VDLIEEVADTCILYGIAAPTPVALEQAAIIVRQCEQLQSAIVNLRQFKDLSTYWIEVHRLENEGDRIVRHAIAELFTDGQDPTDIIKWKDVYALPRRGNRQLRGRRQRDRTDCRQARLKNASRGRVLRTDDPRAAGARRAAVVK